MQVKVNNQLHHLEEHSRYFLADILSTLVPDLPPKGIAVALNHHVIPFQDWPKTAITNHDEILIITATQGG